MLHELWQLHGGDEAPTRQLQQNGKRRQERQPKASTAPIKVLNTPKACVFVNPACGPFKANLRLAFEAAPLAFLVEAAGGASSVLELVVPSGGCDEEGGDKRVRSVLDVPITSMTQVTPLCVGAAEEVARCNSRIMHPQWRLAVQAD